MAQGLVHMECPHVEALSYSPHPLKTDLYFFYLPGRGMQLKTPRKLIYLGLEH